MGYPNRIHAVILASINIPRVIHEKLYVMSSTVWSHQLPTCDVTVNTDVSANNLCGSSRYIHIYNIVHIPGPFR